MADDGLQISVDADRTAVELMTASIDKLIASVDKLVQSSSKTSSVGDAFANFKLDPNVEKSFASLSATLKKMSETRISELQTQINSLKADQVAELTTAFDKLSQVTRSLQSGNIAEMSRALKDTSASAGGVKTLSDALNKFWQDAAKAVSGSGSLKTALSGMSASFSEVAKMAGGTQQGISAIVGGLSGLGTVLTGLGIGASIVALYKFGEVIIGMGQSIIRVTEEAMNLKATINSLSAGSGEAAFASLRKTADETGLSVSALAGTFTQYMAGAVGMGVSTSVAEQEFAKLTKGFRGAGASAQETEQAMRALTQMMGKGKIQAQELVLQLGNASPIALQKMAESLHTTRAGLMELSKAGALLPQGVIDKFADTMFNSFGGALSERLMTVTSQLTILRNKFEDLGRSVGMGTFVGLESGLAMLISGFNNVLGGIAPLTNAIAALAGTLVGGVLGAIGLVINGFGNLLNGIQNIASAFMNGLSIIGAWANKFDFVKTVVADFTQGLNALGMNFEGFGGRAAVVGDILGTLTAAAITLKLGWGGLVFLFPSLIGGLTAMVGAIGRVIVAKAMLIGMTNPLAAGIAVAAAAAAGAAAAYLLYTSSMDKAAEETRKFKASADGVSYGAEQIANGGEKAARAALKLGTAFLTASGAAKAMAVETERLSETERNLKDQMDAQAASMKQLEEGQRSLNAEYEAAKNANAQEIVDLQNRKAHWQELDKAIQSSSSSMGGAGGSASRAAGDFGNLDRSIRNLGQSSKQIELDMKASQASFKDRMDREKAYQDGLNQTMNKLREVEEWQKKYGVTSNETTREIVKMASAAQIFGKEAGGLAQTYDLATTAAYNFQGALQEEINKNKQVIEARTELIKKLEGVVAELGKQEAAARKAGDELKADVFKDAQAGSAALISNYKGLNAEQIQLVIAQRALKEALNGGGDTLALITKYAKEYAQEAGKDVDVNKLVAESTKKIGEAAKTVVGEQVNAAGASKKATEELAKQAKELKDTAENASKFAGIVKDSAAYIDKATTSYSAMGAALSHINGSAGLLAPSFDAIKVSLQGMAPLLPQISEALTALVPPLMASSANAPKLAQSLTEMADATVAMTPLLPEMASGVEAMIEPVNAVSKPIAKVAEAFTAMSETLPVVASSFANFTESATALDEPLKAVVVNLGRMAGYAPGLSSVATALGEVATNLGTISDSAALALPTLGKLNPVLDGISTGFSKASSNASSFGTALDNLHGNIDSLISKMQQLIDKAAEAMRASKMGPSSTTGEVSQQREGGYAGQGPSTSVSHSAFANAPHFAAGTANTSNYTHALSNGGIPSILHPNEAVIPLSKGRTIPVELSHSPNTNAISSLVKGIVGGLSDTFTQHAATTTVAETRMNNASAPAEVKPAPTPVLRQSAAVDYATSTTVQSGSPYLTGGRINGTTPSNAPIHIHMNISTPDADSFRKSKEQINTELFTKMKTAFNKNA